MTVAAKELLTVARGRVPAIDDTCDDRRLSMGLSSGCWAFARSRRALTNRHSDVTPSRLARREFPRSTVMKSKTPAV